jgi:serine protease Do
MRALRLVVLSGFLLATAVCVSATPQSGSPGPQERFGAPMAPRAPAYEVWQRSESSGLQLGVFLRDLDEATAKEKKLPTTDGALVDRVESGSAAEKAGLRSGDVIVEFDGERVRTVAQLRRLITESRPGKGMFVTVVRNGSRLTVTVVLSRGPVAPDLFGGTTDWQRELERRLGELRKEFKGPRAPLYQWTPGAGRLGVVIQELTPQLAEFFGVKEGVLVTTVTPDSAAAQAGLKAADVITKANGEAVARPDGLIAVVRDAADGETLTLEVVRDHKTLTLKAVLTGRGRTVGTTPRRQRD